MQAGAAKGSTTALGFLDKGPGVWRTFIVTLGDLCSAPCFGAGFFSNQGHLHQFRAKVKSFEEKYLQDRFSATARKLDDLLPILLPHWPECEAVVCDEVAVA